MKNEVYITKQLELFESVLGARNYAESTKSTYASVLKKFLEHFGCSACRINGQQITAYISTGNCGATKAQMRGALKNYYDWVQGSPNKFDKIPYPKKEQKLPRIISQQEVKRRMDNIPNLKHHTIISVLYGAGLRRSEVINLKVSNIDGERKTLFIEGAKGMKDRSVLVSEHLITRLRLYWKVYKPKEYLFEGQFGGRYSAESVRNICQKYMNIHPHGIRHWHATHLVENGLHLSELAERLGHADITTTQRYNHITSTSTAITLMDAA